MKPLATIALPVQQKPVGYVDAMMLSILQNSEATPSDSIGFRKIPVVGDVAIYTHPQAALPEQPPEPMLAMKPMQSKEGTKGWYVDGPDFYIDIDKRPGESYEVFVRDKHGVEGFAEGKPALTVQPESVK